MQLTILSLENTKKTGNRKQENKKIWWRSHSACEDWVLGLPSYTRVRILSPFRGRYIPLHVPLFRSLHRFLVRFTVTVRSDLSFITVLVPIITGLDPDMFTLVREEVLDFWEHLPVLFCNIFLNLFILLPLSLLAFLRIPSNLYNFYPILWKK